LQPDASTVKARIAAQPALGRTSNAQPAAIGVSVLLVIGSDGQVDRIFWDKLPALTDEQLRRVEAAIRAKSYIAGQTITEIFDVRGFLRLPREYSEDTAILPPAPETD
jgi:hypothetical protein